ATYSGDNNNTGPVSSGCAAEPLTVSPNTPTISTTVSPAGHRKSRRPNSSNVSLRYTTAGANNNISTALYVHNVCRALVSDLTPTTTTFFYSSVPDHRALHSFPTRRSSDLATYSGDNNNTGPVSSGCAAEPLTVSPNTPTISTTVSPA